MKKLVEKYIKFVKENNIPIESIVLSNNKEILIKHDFKKLRYRNIYSHTKSFVSLLIGIAIDENKLSLEDKLIYFFKNDLSKVQKNKLKDIKVKHLLTMSSGFGKPLLMMGDREKGVGYKDYLKYIFKQKLIYKPGEKFVYSNGDTYLLARILEKIYKETFQVILYDKLLKPLNIPYSPLETDFQGRAVAASGLFLNCEDMNKLGRLLINNGKWDNKKIISKKYISMISKSKIKTKNNDDYSSDYSYQFWICPYKNTIRADGAYGQITLIFLDENLSLSYQSPEFDNNANLVIKTIREKILDPYFKRKKK